MRELLSILQQPRPQRAMRPVTWSSLHSFSTCSPFSKSANQRATSWFHCSASLSFHCSPHAQQSGNLQIWLHKTDNIFG